MFLGGKTYCEANADIVLERRLRLVVVSGNLKLVSSELCDRGTKTYFKELTLEEDYCQLPSKP